MVVALQSRYIFDSFFISCAVTVLAVVSTIPATHSFARFEYRFRDGILTAFLAVNMVGAAVLIIPLYKLMFSLGLLNTCWAMSIAGAAFTVPTGIFLMRSFFLRDASRARWRAPPMSTAPRRSTPCGG